MKMKHRLNFITIIIIIIGTFTDCMYENITHMNLDEKKWLSSYKEGDIFLYKSDKDIDTLYITFVEVENSKFPFHISESGTSNYKAGGIINYYILHSGLRIGGSLIAVKENDSIFSLKLDIDRRLYEEKSIERIYNDCIIVNSKNSRLSSQVNQSIIKSFTWNKSKGLLNYILEDGSIYHLSEK